MKLKLIVLTAALAIGGLTASAFAKGGGHKGQFGARKAAMLAKFDTNNDGKLDDAEKAKAIEARAAMREKRIETRFASMDANKDGVVTLAEMKAAKPLKGKGHKKHGRGHRLAK